PTLGTREESGAERKPSTPLSVDVYEQRQEERIKATVEKAAHEIELKGGDPFTFVRRLARDLVKMAKSLNETEDARHDLIALDRVLHEDDAAAGGSPAYMCKSHGGVDGPDDNDGGPPPRKEKLTQATPQTPQPERFTKSKSAEVALEVLEDAARRVGHALQFAAERIGVLPIWGVADGICDCPKGSECRSPGKHPHGRLAPNGVYSASYDAKTIRGWFESDPRINYGLAMGGELNLICVDIDPRNDGDATYCDLVEHYGPGAFPVTFEQRTGGDGWHKLYRMPEAMKAAKGELKAKLGPGVDVKGEGGYIVGAASMHVSGKTYEVETNEYIAWASACVIEALRKSRDGAEPERVISFQSHRDRKDAAASGVARRYGVGERNNGLRDNCLGRWVHGWAETPEDLLRQLIEVRDTRCEWSASDPPPSDSELRDLVERTVRKFARGFREGAA
ncbi:MAG TPA: bifunctional DNA primase/polymerase, partial [Pyrinomonadaceae bacterium]|nr:bifunctional DNA primase/polymerase [Pyrinomonadaceae bacterium]